MKKNKSPTLKAAIAEQSRQISKIAKDASNKIDEWESEATALFDALEDADVHQVEEYLKQNPPSAGAISFIIFVTRDRFKATQAQTNALKRHSIMDVPRQFIQGEWEKYRDVYKGNKSAFSRDYSRRVKHEFGVDVTERTIREVWLKGL